TLGVSAERLTRSQNKSTQNACFCFDVLFSRRKAAQRSQMTLRPHSTGEGVLTLPFFFFCMAFLCFFLFSRKERREKFSN
ncbi:MAG: hypothetical protein J6J21_01010, partial [Clostridia bacterium]|nr:hypothetical protein [Clostridia bacterium]